MKLLKSIYYFFPLQLILLQFRKNILFTVLWFLLIAIITSKLGIKMGLPYLFLDPEYLGNVDFVSLFMVGIAFGIFICAYNISTYILDGRKYQFLAYSSLPFINYSLNNSVLPLLFIVVYLYEFVAFQNLYESSVTGLELFLEVFAFLLGVALIVGVAFVYFKFTNKNWYRLLAGNIDTQLKKRSKYNRGIALSDFKKQKSPKYRVDTFIEFGFKLRKVSVLHFRRDDRLLKVFDQNHLNAVASMAIILTITLLLAIVDHPVVFGIPAAVSLLLVVSLLTMVLGFVYYWFRKWYLFGSIVLVLLGNYMFDFEQLNTIYKLDAFDYENAAKYNPEELMSYYSGLPVTEDSLQTIEALNNWRSKFPEDQPPTMILTMVSGGGHRSANWTFNVLQTLDSVTSQQFAENVPLITGASGGMIGAAYYRELALRRKNELSVQMMSDRHNENIGKDILNPVALKMLIRDPLVLDLEWINSMDRGAAFEHQLNYNTNKILEKNLSDYREPELSSKIPMMIFSPTIVRNSTNLYMSALPVSYMVEPNLESTHTNGIEFRSYLKEQIKSEPTFLNTLRMSASFPFVSPVITMPTEPAIKITDAGLSDTYGVQDAVRFSYFFNDWINKNTKGVVFLAIRDAKKFRFKEPERSFFKSITNPFDVAYQKYFDTQDLYNDESLTKSKAWLENVEYLEIVYDGNEDDIRTKKASLSWHLTGLEKENIKQALKNQDNLHTFNLINNLVNP